MKKVKLKKQEIKKSSDVGSTYVRNPVIRLSKEELQKQKLADYAKRASKKESPVLQSRSSTPDKARKSLYNQNRRQEILNKGLKVADVATDIMQLGNFVPHPAAQLVGKVGNALGGAVDSFQAGMEARKGNYGSAATNATSAVLPSVIKNPKVLGGYRRSAKYGFNNRSFYNPIDKRYGRMTTKQLAGNRAILGSLAGETAYDSNN